MATAIIAGKDGTVTWASDSVANSSATAWTLEATCEVVDVTSVDGAEAGADQGWRKFIRGRVDWTASVDTLNTGADPTATAGTAAILTLSDGTNSISLAKSICTGLTLSSSQTAAPTTTYSFVCAGAV